MWNSKTKERNLQFVIPKNFKPNWKTKNIFKFKIIR